MNIRFFMEGIKDKLERVLDLLDKWIEYHIAQSSDIQQLIVVELFPTLYDLYEQMRWQESYNDIRVQHQEESIQQEMFDQFMQSNEPRCLSSKDTDERIVSSVIENDIGCDS